MTAKMRAKIEESGRSASNLFFAIPYLIAIMFVVGVGILLASSGYLSEKAAKSNSISEFDDAIYLSPSKIESLILRANLFSLSGDHKSAISDLQQAARLSPFDHHIRKQLGDAYSNVRDFNNAQNTYLQEIELGPNYSSAKWALGSLLLREGSYDSGFYYLNLAANSDPKLLTELLRVARATFSDDEMVDRSIRPESLSSKKTVAIYFIEHNISSRRNADFLTGELPEAEKPGFIRRSIEKQNFKLAYEIWESQNSKRMSQIPSSDNLILDGGFEQDFRSDDDSFGWNVNRDVTNVGVISNNDQAAEGLRSALIEFQGNSDPTMPVLTQLVMVLPDRSYRVTYLVRSEEKFVSGGLPALTVKDAVSGNVIASSSPPITPISTWNRVAMEFRTGPTSKAVIIAINRKPCPTMPCPAFGRIRFDHLELSPI